MTRLLSGYKMCVCVRQHNVQVSPCFVLKTRYVGYKYKSFDLTINNKMIKEKRLSSVYNKVDRNETREALCLISCL